MQKISVNDGILESTERSRGAGLDQFKLVAPYKPNGDQPQAIQELVDGIENGVKEQTLLGATGTGKTFTIANVIQEVNKQNACWSIIR